MARLAEQELDLTEDEQTLFGRPKLLCQLDDQNKGYVLNIPQNGLAIGDTVRSSRNGYFGTNRTDGTIRGRRYKHALTGLAEELQADKIQLRGNFAETSSLLRWQAQLGDLAAQLSDWRSWSEPKRQRFLRVIEAIARENARVYNPAKREAVDAMQAALSESASLGEMFELLQAAVGRFGERQDEVAGQRSGASQRSRWIQDQLSQEQQQIGRLVDELVLGTIGWRQAAMLRFKPGVLTANNLWVHRREREYFDITRRALAGFDQLQPAMMKPLRMLVAEKLRHLETDPAATVAGYTMLLEDLLDMAEESDPGGDFTNLVARLRNRIFICQECLLAAMESPGRTRRHLTEARKQAEAAIYLLRYRCLPGEEPPPEWYTNLPDVPHSRGWDPFVVPSQTPPRPSAPPNISALLD